MAITETRMIEGVKPILKPLHAPLQTINQFRDLIAMLEHRYQTYGKVAARFFAYPEGTPNAVILFGAEFNRLVLSKPDIFHHGGMDSLGDEEMRQLSHGLLFQNGELHLEHRRLMMPAFHKKSVESYRELMVEISENFVQQWQHGEIRDINHEMHQLTMHIASRTLFGLDLSDNSVSIGELIVEVLDVGTNPLVFILPYNRPPFPRYYFFKKGRELVASIRAIIQKKKESQKESHDLLSVLIHAEDENGKCLSDAELIGQANTLFVAGHETTANALSYILLLLSQHPAMMEKLYAELETVLAGKTPELDDLPKLAYMDAIIKEGMRLFPPAAFVNRWSQEDFSAGTYTFPKHTWITLSQYITHRMPELYESPRSFMPERWETIQPSIYEYLPFGAGSRMCIGASFATMEMKIVLAIILQKYRLALVPNSRIERSLTVTLGMKSELPMQYHRQLCREVVMRSSSDAAKACQALPDARN